MTKSQVTFHTGHATRRPEPIAGPSAPPLSPRAGLPDSGPGLALGADSRTESLR